MGDLIEIYKVMISREIINWGLPLNLRKNVEISGPTANVGPFLKMDQINNFIKSSSKYFQ